MTNGTMVVERMKMKMMRRNGNFKWAKTYPPSDEVKRVVATMALLTPMLLM